MLGSFSYVCAQSLFVTLWTVAHQAPLFMGFPRQEYWSGWPFPPPGDLPDLGIELVSAALAGKCFTAKQWKPYTHLNKATKKKDF